MALPTEDGIVATARGFLVVLALSIHDLFEGVALGVARSGPFLNFKLSAFMCIGEVLHKPGT